MNSLERRLIEEVLADLPRRVAVAMRDHASQAFTVAFMKAAEEADLGAPKVNAQAILEDLWKAIAKTEHMFLVPLSTTELDVLRDCLDILSTWPQNDLLAEQKGYINELRNKLDEIRHAKENAREPEKR